MNLPRQTVIPTLVRVKPGALDRLGEYCRRFSLHRVVVLFSEGLPEDLRKRLKSSLSESGIELIMESPVHSQDFDETIRWFRELPSSLDAILGFGGGKALDVAKYVAFLSRRPLLAVPTSLSNDGFCSPQSSLSMEGRRTSLAATVPFGVVIDTHVCLHAPRVLWHSGVGDLVAKFPAVVDWKLAFHATGELVDDFAALLSDASVYQFLGRPEFDAEGIRLLGTALLLNGVSMSICGSSRPASGSEHLISHALDQLGGRERLHGLQVGVASYLVSCLQGQHSDIIGRLLDRTGFWDVVAEDPFSRDQWMEAVRMAPTVKENFHTILSEKDCLPEVGRLLKEDVRLARCFGSG